MNEIINKISRISEDLGFTRITRNLGIKSGRRFLQNCVFEKFDNRKKPISAQKLDSKLFAFRRATHTSYHLEKVAKPENFC